MEDENRTGSSSRGGSGTNEFVRKLFTMLEDPTYREIVRWSDPGDSFVVLDTNEFTTTILPRHFKHSNFASFVRQLNKYDFHKIRATETGTATYGENAWEFKHPDFRKDNKSQIDNIRRKNVKRPNSNKNNNNNSTSNNTNDSSSHNENINSSDKNGTNSNENNTNSNADGNSANTSVSQDLEKELKAELQTLKTEIHSYKSLTQSLQLSLNTLHESHAVALHKLATLEKQNRVTSSVLRKVLVMETSNAQAHEKRIHVLDLLQQLNTSESTRNDNSESMNNMRIAQITNSQSNVNAHTATSSNINTSSTITISTHPYPPPSSHHQGPFSVLLVDDNEASARKIRKTLQEHGCEVTTVSDGITAWRCAETNLHSSNSSFSKPNTPIDPLAPNQPIDTTSAPPNPSSYDTNHNISGHSAHSPFTLVLLNLVIPSLDGVSVASQMRKAGVTCPIIALADAATQSPSSLHQIAPEKQALYAQNGITEVLLKPFKKDVLVGVLEKYLGEKYVNEKAGTTVDGQQSNRGSLTSMGGSMGGGIRGVNEGYLPQHSQTRDSPSAGASLLADVAATHRQKDQMHSVHQGIPPAQSVHHQGLSPIHQGLPSVHQGLPSAQPVQPAQQGLPPVQQDFGGPMVGGGPGNGGLGNNLGGMRMADNSVYYNTLPPTSSSTSNQSALPNLSNLPNLPNLPTLPNQVDSVNPVHLPNLPNIQNIPSHANHANHLNHASHANLLNPIASIGLPGQGEDSDEARAGIKRARLY